MRSLIKFSLGILALSFALCIADTATVRADDAAAKPAAMPQVGLIAVRSIDSATSFMKQTGIDVPKALSAQGLEEQFVFIGQGGLDTTRPIGIVLCGGPNLEFQQMMAFVFPVKPTGGTLESIKAMGATPMPDHADTVLLGGVGLRRTNDYLIVSPNPAVAVNVDTDSMLAAVKGPDALAKMVIDFKTLRTAMPDQYKQMIEFLKTSATEDAQSPADKENAMIFVTPMLKAMDTIDRMDMGVESGEKGIRVALSATPLKVVPALAGAVRPGMPDDIFARFDTNFAATESTAGIRYQIQRAFNKGTTDDDKMSAQQKKEVVEIGNRFGALVFDPATTSIGVGADGAAPVLYIVQHWANPTDVPGELQRLIKRMNTVLGGDASGVKTETYTEDGLTVLRIGQKSDKPSEAEVDVAQRDNDVFITISSIDKHLVQLLANAKPQGPMNGVLSGWVDLDKSLEAAEKFPGSPLAGLPADTQKQLADLLQGQKIRINTTTDGDTGILEATVTKGLLENVPKLIELFTAPPKATPDAK